MASIKDVAKKAHVGVATVSRALNGSGYVSQEAREKIEKAMEELNYTPNELARNLFHKKTGIIAVLVPDISNPFFAEFVQYVETELSKVGYKTMLCTTAKEENLEMEYLDMLNRSIVDGVITGVHSLNIEEYKKIEKPIVALDRYLGEKIPVVAVDHGHGGILAADLLIASGCKKVINFCGNRAIEAPYHERHSAFSERMRQHGIEVKEIELGWNHFEREYYQKEVEKAFADGIDYDGIFGVDQIAIASMHELLRKGKRIPDDVKVVAYDGTLLARMTQPVLTAICQPIEKLAIEAVTLVSEMVGGKCFKNKKILLDVELKIGQTTINP